MDGQADRTSRVARDLHGVGQVMLVHPLPQPRFA